MKKFILGTIVCLIATAGAFCDDVDAGFQFNFGFAPTYTSNRNFNSSAADSKTTNFKGEILFGGYSADPGLNIGIHFGLGFEKDVYNLTSALPVYTISDETYKVSQNPDFWDLYATARFAMEFRISALSIGASTGINMGYGRFSFITPKSLTNTCTYSENDIFVDIPIEPYAAISFGRKARLNAGCNWDLPFLHLVFSGKDGDSQKFTTRFFNKDDIAPTVLVSLSLFL